MSKTKLIILTTAVIIAQIAVAVAAYDYVNDTLIPQQVDEKGSQTDLPTADVDPADLEKEAEAQTLTNPAEASQKYEEASQIYEDLGNEPKAAEAAANAESTGLDFSDNELTAAPPVESSSQP